ncbi:MAG: heavy metal-binding domain-containing protein [Fidelibacterota bacterium]
MKTILIISTALLVFACNKTEKAETHEHNMGATMGEAHEHDGMAMDQSGEPEIGEDETLIYFTCPMPEHKDVHHVDPGKCEKCGMTLVAGVITSKDKMDYYGCPMLIHSHVRHAEPGKCDECGMKLMPMRLTESD